MIQKIIFITELLKSFRYYYTYHISSDNLKMYNMGGGPMGMEPPLSAIMLAANSEHSALIKDARFIERIRLAIKSINYKTTTQLNICTF